VCLAKHDYVIEAFATNPSELAAPYGRSAMVSGVPSDDRGFPLRESGVCMPDRTLRRGHGSSAHALRPKEKLRLPNSSIRARRASVRWNISRRTGIR
jgi:hypothetical protein